MSGVRRSWLRRLLPGRRKTGDEAFERMESLLDHEKTTAANRMMAEIESILNEIGPKIVTLIEQKMKIPPNQVDIRFGRNEADARLEMDMTLTLGRWMPPSGRRAF